MKADHLRRLEQLEKKIKAAKDTPIWVDGYGTRIRVDIGGKRGEEVDFPSVCEMRTWLEPKINSHPGGVIGYHVDNVADLCEDAEGLRLAIKQLLPGQIVVPDLTPRLEHGEITYVEKTGAINHPLTLTADYLPGTLAIRGIIPGAKANLLIWCLASLIERYFDSRAVTMRRKADQPSADDVTMFHVLFLVYAWGKKNEQPGELFGQFCELVSQLIEQFPITAG